MFVDNEPIIAQCPLDTGSSTRLCLLSYEKLIVKERKRTHTFELAEVQNIEIKKKLLLLPLISGGVLAPLSLIAIFNDLLNLWVMLLAFMIGVLLIYYGVEGRFSLSILTNLKEYDFFINSPNKNIKAFIQFVLKRILNREVIYYLALSDEEWKSAQVSGYLEFKHPKELRETSAATDSHIILKLEPLKVDISVNYIPGADTDLVPAIQGKFPLNIFTRIS